MVPALLKLLVISCELHVAPAQPLQQSAVTFAVGLERKAERDRFHFDNPSSFGSSMLVPHFFEQRYEPAGTWLLVAASYPAFGGVARTKAAFLPRLRSFGSDVDTFFQPTGDVVTSGTRGDVSLRSLSLNQRFQLATWRTWSFGVAFEYRRAEADFPPEYRVVTHTLPASETREFITSREMTTSHVFASGISTEVRLPSSDGWHLTAGGDFYPTTRAWLVTELPEKYPGESIVASAFVFGAAGQLTLERQFRRFAIGAALTLKGTRGYRSTSSYSHRAAAGSLFVRVGG